VDEGDEVRQGSALMELWNEDLKARLDLAESEVRTFAAVETEACLGAELAARDAARLSALHEQRIIDEAAVDRATAERDRAQAACTAARARNEEGAARVAAANAALAQTRLVAPFDGVIARLNAELGEVVTPSPPGIPTVPAVDLIEPGCLYVVAPIDEVDAPLVRIGDEARVTLDAFPDRIFAGVVRRVAPFVLEREKQARTVDVEVDLLHAGETVSLLPGYSADVEILLDWSDEALRVPTEAVVEDGRVLVFSGGELAAKDFEPGLSNWKYTQVLSGLSEGERVVVSLDRDGVETGARAVEESSVER